jgi:hypothetical protein
MRVKAKCRRISCANLIKKNASFYCSVKCQREFLHEQYIAKWLAGEIDGSKRNGEGASTHIRRYLMETCGFKCSVCGWGERNPRTGLVPLHVDHIDGNAQNNRPENLRLLCPNDHALTETYGATNWEMAALDAERATSKAYVFRRLSSPQGETHPCHDLV